MSEKATPQQADEVFAFELAYWFHLNTNDPETAGKTRDDFVRHWQDATEYRDRARKRAKSLQQAMQDVGLRADHIQNSKQVLKSLEAILTRPATTAYELPGEEAPFAQSTTPSAEGGSEQSSESGGLGAMMGLGGKQQ